MDEMTIVRRAVEEAPIPDDPWEGFRRRRHHRQVTSRIAAATVAFVVFAGASVVLARAFQSSAPAAGQEGVASLNHYPPLAGGVKVTFAEAQSMTGLEPIIPDTSLASAGSIAQVWARRKSPDILVIYASGVASEVRRWSMSQTPDEHWNALISQGLPGSIVTLYGQDVYLMPPVSGRSTGSVNFVTSDGTWVSIYGEGVASAGQLQEMATTAVRWGVPSPYASLAQAQQISPFGILLPTTLPPGAQLDRVDWSGPDQNGVMSVDIRWTSSVGQIHLWETNNTGIPSDKDPANPKLGTSVKLGRSSWVIIPTAFKGLTQIGTRSASGITLEIDAQMSEQNLEGLAASIAAQTQSGILPSSSSPRLNGGTPILRCPPGVPHTRGERPRRTDLRPCWCRRYGCPRETVQAGSRSFFQDE